MMKSFLLFILLSVFISSCCSNIQCDCIAPGVNITYEKLNTECPNSFDADFLLKRFSSLDDQLISTGLVSQYGSINLCYLEINYEEDIYWVISSALFDISDTLRINTPIFEGSNSNSCCDCAPRIESADIRINDRVYSSPNMIRLY